VYHSDQLDNIFNATNDGMAKHSSNYTERPESAELGYKFAMKDYEPNEINKQKTNKQIK
jgi:hypothetical protein